MWRCGCAHADNLKPTKIRTHIERIINKAGLKRWPKLFQNLRSTRETELAERWPEHVVCAWIGNSKAVTRENYLQVTEEHFERAAGIVDSNNEGTEKAAQNTELPCTASHTVGEHAKNDTKRGPARQYEHPVGRGGFEPP